MKEVVFLKAGTPYGYGYAAGELGTVHEKDKIRTDTIEGEGGKKKQRKVIIAYGFTWLQQNGIVRSATAADKKAAKTQASDTENDEAADPDAEND